MTKQLEKEREEAARKAEEERQRKEAEARAAKAANPEPKVIVKTQPDPKGKAMRITGISLGVVGLVGVGLGVKYGLDASSIDDELSSHEGPWTEAVLARIDDGEDAERNSIIFTSIGAGAIAVGGLLYWLGMDSEPTAERVTLIPTASDQSFGMTLGGFF